MRLRFHVVLATLVVIAGWSSAANADKVYKVAGVGTTKIAGKEMLIISLLPITGGRSLDLFVPNKDVNAMKLDPVSPLGDVVKTFKAGDWVKADPDPATKGALKTIVAYVPKPYELTLTGFTLGTSYKTPNGRAIQLTKLEESYEAVVGTVKSEEGNLIPDPKLEKMIETLKVGDAVDAEVTGSGKKLTLVSLDPYKEPQLATFDEATEIEVSGEKVPAAKIEVGGKPVTAIVRGQLQGKKWVPDRVIAAFVKRLKKGAEISVKTTDEEGKTYLRKIEMAKKSAAPKEASKEKPAAKKEEKKDEKPAEKK